MGTFVVKHPKRDLWCEVKADWTGPLIARDKVVTKVLDDQRGAQLPRHDGDTGNAAQTYRPLLRRHGRDDLSAGLCLRRGIPPAT
ncbi:hypothetical protein [Mameliella sp.]